MRDPIRSGRSPWSKRRPLSPTVCRTLLLFAASFALAQEEPSRPAQKNGLRITFLPPPIEGTLSVGIYDSAGKLVRTLHRESTEADFTVGLNGLITMWDGKDDRAQPVAPGKYAARGYAVGEVDVEGVAYHCNDWFTETDSPRIRRISRIAVDREDRLRIAGLGADGRNLEWRCDAEGKLSAVNQTLAPGDWQSTDRKGQPLSVVGGKVYLGAPEEPNALNFAGLRNPTHATFGRSDSVWVIDRMESEGRAELKEFSMNGELRRRLAPEPGAPSPSQVAAAKNNDTLFVLEEDLPGERLQRIRSLTWAGTDPAPQPDGTRVSKWQVAFERRLHPSDTFAAVADKVRDKPFLPEDKIRVRLLPNQLLKGASTELDLQIGVDPQGAFFKTPDGLPLLQITETTSLKWAVMGREGGRVVTIFQSDGAVVEEFKVRKLANMMAFDAGEYEWGSKEGATSNR